MSHDMPTPDASAGPGYETTDVKISAVLWLGLAVALTIIVTQFGLWYLWKNYEADARESDPAQSPLLEKRPQTASRLSQSPAADAAARTADMAGKEPPRLQERSDLDLREFLSREDSKLKNYGWINREQGIVRIPIDRAMDLLVERGLPKQAATVPIALPSSTPPGSR